MGNNIGHIFIFDLFSEKKMTRIESHGKIVRSIAFTSDSMKIISVSDDLHINIIDLYLIYLDKKCVLFYH